MRSGDWTRRVCAAVAALTALSWAQPVSAGRVAVLGIESPPELRAEAGAIEMLLRSHLPSDDRAGVELPALLEAFGGRRGPMAPGDDPAAAMKRVGADRLVHGTLRRVGTRVAVDLVVLGADGKKLTTLSASGPRGAINGLVTSLLRDAASSVGDNLTERPRGAVGELRPFVDALDALAGSDPERAARGLLSSRIDVPLHDVREAHDIARAVWRAPALPFDLRASVMIASGDISELGAIAERRLRDAPGDDDAVAALAAAALARRDLRAAGRHLDKVRRSKRPLALLVRAQYADVKRDVRGRDKLVRQLLELHPPFLPALGWIARLPAGHLGDDVEARALAVMARLRETYPGLAAGVGMRAAADREADRAAALDLIDVAELGDRDLATLASSVDAAVDVARPVALRLRAGIRTRRGEAGALEDVTAALEASGDDPRLVALKEDLEADQAGGLDAARDVELAGDEGADAASDAAKPSALVLDLAAELTGLLRTFPDLAGGDVRHIALAPMAGGGSAFYSPYSVDASRLGQALEHALQAPPYGYRVTAIPERTFGHPPARSALVQAAQASGANGVVLYRVTNDGSDAVVTLLFFDAASATASENSRTLPGRELGLVGWNHLFVGFVAVVLFGVLGFIGLRVLRGAGVVGIKIDLDDAADRDVICVRLTRKPTPQDVGDVHTFADRIRKHGVKKRKLAADMVPRKARFEGVAPGTWWVTVWGTYEKGNEIRALSGELSQKVRVRRGKATFVTFDLKPTAGEYRLAVYDGESPVQAEVWLDDDRAGKHSTTTAGKLDLIVPLGPHTLHVVARGTHVRRDLHVADTDVHNLTINLVRERRLQDVATGIALDSGDAEPMQIQRSESSVRPRAPAGSAATAALAAAPSANGADTRYRRDQELGRGAMGVVYRGFDTVLERVVALKVMSADIKQFPGAVDLFRQEAKSLAALNHPNIVTVFDQSSDAGELLLVMEFVEGTTLEDVLERHQRLTPDKAVQLTEQLCAGLAYAHGRRVIHRDIKPANVFITRDGTVKLGDFGLARVVNEVRIKQTMVRGTPLYMSPEQIHGADIDFRADLYAVGCTLYEMLTGRPPFVEGEIMYHHLHTEPDPPSRHAADIPAALDQIVLACIAKDAADRIASAEALARQLARLRGQLGR